MRLRPSGRVCVASAPEAPSLCAPGVRRHLFTALAWAAGAFAVIALLSPDVAGIARTLSYDPGVLGAVLGAGVGLLGCYAVPRVAMGLDARDRTGAHVLLWVATLASAILVGLVAVGAGAEALVDLIPVAVLNVAGSAVAALVIALAIASRLLRGAVFFLIVLGPFLVLAPDLWWLGLMCAVLLILAVEEVLHHAVQMRHVPEPALAACLVAAVVALPLFLLYVTVRFLVLSVLSPLPDEGARERNASREPRGRPPPIGSRASRRSQR